MIAPDVLGRCLEEARAMLEHAGVPIAHISETTSPKGHSTGPVRVIRQRAVCDGVEFVTAASVSGPHEKKETSDDRPTVG